MSRLHLRAKEVGLDIAISRLKDFPNKVQRDALRPAFRQIGSILSRDVKSQLPGKKRGTTGRSKLSIGVKLSVKGTRVFLTVGPRSGFGIYTTSTGEQHKETKSTRKELRVRFKGVRGVRFHNPTRMFHIYERGATRMAGRHPLEIALNRNKSRFPGIVKEHVDRAIAKHGINSK